MEELIFERLEEGVDAFFVEAMDEFQKVRDKIHLDEEKAEQLEIKESDCTEAIRALKDLHYSGRWGGRTTQSGLLQRENQRIQLVYQKSARVEHTAIVERRRDPTLRRDPGQTNECFD